MEGRVGQVVYIYEPSIAGRPCSTYLLSIGWYKHVLQHLHTKVHRTTFYRSLAQTPLINKKYGRGETGRVRYRHKKVYPCILVHI